MASHRTTPAHATIPPAIPSTRPRPTRPTTATPPAPAAGQRDLKRAALYARVSTEKQEREETVASQVDLLYQAAAASGYDIAPTSVFIDEGVSGARLDRPALDRLRDLAAEGAFEVLLVTVPDRLARRYAYQVLLVEELTRCGCEVVFVQHGLGGSPEEQMLLQMQGVFAEYERARLATQGQQLRARVQEIEQQRRDRAAELRLLEGVHAFCASIRDAMVAPSFEVKQKVLQLVVQRIVVEEHRITIEHVVPSGPLRLQTEHQPCENLR